MKQAVRKGGEARVTLGTEPCLAAWLFGGVRPPSLLPIACSSTALCLISWLTFGVELALFVH